MGSILKRSGSPFFYARFTVDGREKWISTKKTDRKEARVIADAYENAARGDSSVESVFICECFLHPGHRTYWRYKRKK